ncbi:MAG: Sugar-phosphate isomerase, RpiB/LacA/LacB family [Candidatus Beckwithbacteria bacterium GW2011_GWC2_49_11]|nr:MAG: Sugar-phosphate isomerase, RpiB/LacA/LacB family [Candidatus Beckwithbacteria bacterium GW2011_GWC2_49_11]
MDMKIILGADHGGFELKEEIKKWLAEQNYEVLDVGAERLEPEDDFVDYAVLVAREVASDSETLGILFCRNGYGMMIAANRFPGVRCGEAFDIGAVARGRTDDDINCLSVPADYIKNDNVRKMIEVFLETKFSGEEKYKRRLGKLESLGGGSI